MSEPIADAVSRSSRSSRGTKVFGLGLSKTGTSSLGAALNQLGIQTVHYPHDAATMKSLMSGDYQLALLDRFDGVVDITVAPFYAELDRTWPGSRFVLTLREKSGWMKSISRHWPKMQEWARESPQFDRFTRFISERTYGCWEFDPQRLADAYDQHTADVRRYFRDRPDCLLEMDICSGEGWEKLCPFLDLSIPQVPFPHSNSSRTKESGTRWIEQIRAAREDLSNVVPAGSSIVLIDSYQLADSVIDSRFRVQRLFERDGIDWGPPSDSEAAISRLQVLLDQDVDYLIFGWPAFWWFEEYRGFHEFVTAAFPVRLETPEVVVFELHRDS